MADVVFLSHARHKAGAEIARPDNAAPDKTDRNGLNIRRPKKKIERAER